MWHTIHNDKTDLEHSTYSRELAVESSRIFCLDTYLLELARSRNTHGESYCSDSGTESCQCSRSGMTSEHLTENRGEDLSMLSLVDSLVRILAQQEKEQESKASAADYGQKWHESFARYDHASHSWKTRQCSLFGGWEEFSETWPQWGIMQDGECWALTPMGPTITDTGYGYMPTPTTGSKIKGLENKWASTGGSGSRKALYKCGMSRADTMRERNPRYLEWQMMWPDMWTDAEQSATASTLEWLHSHGKSYQIRKSDNANTQKWQKTRPKCQPKNHPKKQNRRVCWGFGASA